MKCVIAAQQIRQHFFNQFEAMPFFSPENFARINIANALKRKQFIKGIQELQEEGAIHVFRDLHQRFLALLSSTAIVSVNSPRLRPRIGVAYGLASERTSISGSEAQL